MSEINTLPVSGTVRGEVENYDKEDLAVSRFYLGVADSREGGVESAKLTRKPSLWNYERVRG